jgi:hypothetical protein
MTHIKKNIGIILLVTLIICLQITWYYTGGIDSIKNETGVLLGTILVYIISSLFLIKRKTTDFSNKSSIIPIIIVIIIGGKTYLENIEIKIEQNKIQQISEMFYEDFGKLYKTNKSIGYTKQNLKQFYDKREEILEKYTKTTSDDFNEYTNNIRVYDKDLILLHKNLLSSFEILTNIPIREIRNIDIKQYVLDSKKLNDFVNDMNIPEKVIFEFLGQHNELSNKLISFSDYLIKGEVNKNVIQTQYVKPVKEMIKSIMKN